MERRQETKNQFLFNRDKRPVCCFFREAAACNLKLASVTVGKDTRLLFSTRSIVHVVYLLGVQNTCISCWRLD